MTTSQDDIDYAQIQLNEARRRVESVEDRITEIEVESNIGYLNTKSDEISFTPEEVPEEHKEEVVLRNKTEFTEIKGHIQNMIIDCQMCIEMSVKSMFKLVGDNFDYSHGISFSSGHTKNFYYNIPSGFGRHEDIVRSIFLTQFWESFYELAKYGAPELNVGPQTIFNESDAERALNDAKFCVNLAEDMLEYAEQELV